MISIESTILEKVNEQASRTSSNISNNCVFGFVAKQE